jgi:chromatin remodeling complex protein RSC6
MSSASPAAKRTTKKVEAAVATPAAATPSPSPAKATKAVKAAVTAAATPVVAAPVAASPAPVAAAVKADQIDVVAEFTGLAEQVENAWKFIGELRSAVKKFQKQLPKEMKKASKGRRGRKTQAVAEDGTALPKKESVFTRPTAVSDALCQFLGVAKGSLLSRSAVTKQVCDYAKTKGLMDKQNINADAALRKLFGLKETDQLAILNLQRYLKNHYLKAEVVVKA